MKFTQTSREGEVFVVSVNGNVDASNAPELESEINEIISEGNHKIVLDFKELNYISSAGLRVLLSTQKRLKPKNGELKLCELNTEVERIFTMAGFNRLFQIEKTIADTMV